MNSSLLIIGYGITIGIPEIVIFLLAAVVLGFSIHFFWRGRGSVELFENSLAVSQGGMTADDAWRLSFYEEIEKHEQAKARLEKELYSMRQAESKLLGELEETRDEVERLQKEAQKNAHVSAGPSKHISDLVIAQQNLNEYISREMTERLEKTYEEFQFLQDRMHSIESQFTFFKEFLRDIQKVSGDQGKLGDKLRQIRELESTLHSPVK